MFKAMEAKGYIEQRVDQFQGWYDRKAVAAKRSHLQIRTISVVGAALVPVAVNAFPQYPDLTRLVATIASLVVGISVALESVYHFEDQWKNYRSTEQFLSREKFLFQTGEGPYKGVDDQSAFILLAERCEAQIAAENSATLNVIATAAQQTDAVGQQGKSQSN